MAKSKNKESCFIIMPITTPEHLVERYKGDVDHFEHVLEHLFVPALKKAGFKPVSPKSTGSDVIQADIIKQLSSCELVLCDMSILNPNVFFEFGIRTALNKPVALVVDDETNNIPFDTSIINFHKYSGSLDAWSIEKEKQALTEHIQEAYKKNKDHNALWKYFGIAQTGTFKPEEAEMGDKLDLIMREISAFKLGQRQPTTINIQSPKRESMLSQFLHTFKPTDEDMQKYAQEIVQRYLQSSEAQKKASEKGDPQEPDATKQ